MSEWKPIETAPKDGTQILAYAPVGIHGPDFAVVHWYVHESHSYEDAGNGLYRRITQEIDWWEGASYTPFRATHWMPLPSPPVTGKE